MGPADPKERGRWRPQALGPSLLRRCSRSGPPSLRFIEEKSSFEYGQVNHALAAAMRTLLKEYLILVTQLEQLQRQGLLSLQKLWFYIQPAMRTVDILASLGVRAWWEGLPGHPAYLTYMQSTSCKMLGWMKHKLESRLLGEISITSDMQMTPPLWQKVRN